MTSKKTMKKQTSKSEIELPMLNQTTASLMNGSTTTKFSKESVDYENL